jgi:putative endopeptidase
MLFKVVAAACFALVWLIAGAQDAQTSDKPQYGAWGLDLSAMDKQVPPGNDFNRFASGAWLARTQIPADKPMASLRYLMSDRIEARLHEIMEKAAAAAPKEPKDLQGKVGGFYKAFMDEARVEMLGAEPIAAELKAIRAASGRDDIAELMGRNNSDFFATIFTLGSDVDLKDVTRYALYATQGGLGLPDRDYYLQASFAKQKAAYQAYVAQLLELIGWPEAHAHAAAVVDFETKIAEASWTKTEQRNLDKIYNPIKSQELAGLTPGFAWPRFLHGAEVGSIDRVIVAEKSAFVRIGAVYQSTPLDVLQAWQAFSVADNAAFYLSKPYSVARSEFRDKTLSGQLIEPVRWKRAVHAVSGGDCNGDRVDCFGNLGFGVGRLYTARYFSPEYQGGDAGALGAPGLDGPGHQGRGIEETRHLSN